MGKTPFKERYPTIKSFITGESPKPCLAECYIPKTNIYDRREWRGVKDTARAFVFWLNTWRQMAEMAMASPIRTVKAFWKYRWLSAYLCTPHMVDKWTAGDKGMLLKCDFVAVNCMISDTVDILKKMIKADRKLGENEYSDKVIPFDYTLARHIMHGFPSYDSVNINQQCAFMLPIFRMELGAHYVDAAVSTGIPNDLCTLPLVEVGVAVDGEYPDLGCCWLSTNNPCDANMMDNAAMYRALSNNGEKPNHALTSPLMYDDPTTKELAVHEVYEAIHFLEKHLGEPFNWDSFAKSLELTNRFNEQEVERWDIYANSDFIGLNGVCQGLFRIYFYQQGANKYFNKASDKLQRLFAEGYRNKIKTMPNTRHRAVAWSCGSTYYSHAPVWLYNCWGIACVINMDSLTGHHIIDTSNREDMMEDVADLYARTPMRTHTVGGNRHILQVFETARKFNCDMIIMYDDIGCKGMAGCQGLLEEEFRKYSDEFHICWMPHALMDYRTVSPRDARKAVNEYMYTVMREEPLDPTLVDFDDSEGW